MSKIDIFRILNTDYWRNWQKSGLLLHILCAYARWAAQSVTVFLAGRYFRGSHAFHLPKASTITRGDRNFLGRGRLTAAVVFGVKVSPRRGMLLVSLRKPAGFPGSPRSFAHKTRLLGNGRLPRAHMTGAAGVGGVAVPAVAVAAAEAAAAMIKGHSPVVAPFSMGRRRGKTRYTLYRRRRGVGQWRFENGASRRGLFDTPLQVNTTPLPITTT